MLPAVLPVFYSPALPLPSFFRGGGDPHEIGFSSRFGVGFDSVDRCVRFIVLQSDRRTNRWFAHVVCE